MDYTIPIPIKLHPENKNDYACNCKYCKNSKKYLKYWDGCSYLWNICRMCKKKVWYYPEICSLYSRRCSPVVCFYCRIPYYEQGLTNGKIYKIAKEIYT